MENTYFFRREPLFQFLSAVSESNHYEAGLSSRTELLFSVEPSGDIVSVRTRCDISPVQAGVSIKLNGSCELGLNITTSFSGLYKTLKVLHTGEYIGFEVQDTDCIRLFSASKTSILDEEPEFAENHKDSHYQLNSAKPELLTNYLGEPVSDRNITLKLKWVHCQIFSTICQIARANHQPAKTLLVYKHNESGQFMELQSEEIFARFQLSESPFDDEFQAAMRFDDFKALKNVAIKMWKSRSGGLMLDATGDKMILFQNQVYTQFSCTSLSETFAVPEVAKSKSGWIEEDPHKLAQILKKLDVAPSSVDDVVTLQVLKNKLIAEMNTETLEAELQISIYSGKNLNGPIFEVKRQLLINCLGSFPRGHFVEIHGFLTDDTNIIIQSTVNEDYVVMAKMPHVTSTSS